MTRPYVRPKVFKDSKECTKCRVVKPFNNFHKRAAHPTGYATWCKPCTKEYDDAEHDPKRIYPKKLNGEKIHCRRCNEYLDISSFSVKKRSDGYFDLSYCINCEKHLGHHYNMKRLGISPERYVELEKQQEYKCKICGNKDNKRLSVDHDHSCCDSYPACGNCVRGLLCSRCNRALGMINDDIDILQKMINYLK